jgi:hypothetical protein
MLSKELDQLFETNLAYMPPAKNDADPSKSEVIQKIAKFFTLSNDSAVKVFERYRSWSRNVLVFDRISRKWHGRDWRSDNETVEDALRREVAVLVAEVRRLRQEMNSMQKGFKTPFRRSKNLSLRR